MLRVIPRLLVVGLTLSVGEIGTLRAQTVREIPRDPPPPLPEPRPIPRPLTTIARPDSVAMAVGRDALLGYLISVDRRPGGDPLSRPWVISIADRAPSPEWRVLRDTMERAVGAHAVQQEKRAYRFLVVERVMIRADTLIVHFEQGGSEPRRGRLIGNSIHYEVRSIHDGTGWSVSIRTPRRYSDGFC